MLAASADVKKSLAESLQEAKRITGKAPAKWQEGKLASNLVVYHSSEQVSVLWWTKLKSHDRVKSIPKYIYFLRIKIQMSLPSELTLNFCDIFSPFSRYLNSIESNMKITFIVLQVVLMKVIHMCQGNLLEKDPVYHYHWSKFYCCSDWSLTELCIRHSITELKQNRTEKMTSIASINNVCILTLNEKVQNIDNTQPYQHVTLLTLSKQP